MSLINEALKKAQQLRNDEAAAQNGKVLPPGVSLPSRPRASIGTEDSSGGAGANLPVAAQHPVYGVAKRGGPRGGGKAKSKAAWVMGGSAGVIAAVVWFQVGAGAGEGPVSERPAVVEAAAATATVTTETAGSVALTAVAPTPEENRSGARSDAIAEEPAVRGGALVAPVRGSGTGTAVVRSAVTPTASEPVSVVSPVIAPVAATSAGGADVAKASGNGEGSPGTLVASLTEVVRPAEPVAVVESRSGSETGSGTTTATTPAPASNAPATGTETETGTATVAVAPVAVVLSADEAVLRYLERVRVAGVRVSGVDSKVLMNDRVYRLNEMVDFDLQLRVVAIAPRELHFRDRHGYDYKKTF